MTATRTEPCACGATIVAEPSFGIVTAAAIAAAVGSHYETPQHQAWRARWVWASEIPYSAEPIPPFLDELAPSGREMRPRDLELIR